MKVRLGHSSSWFVFGNFPGLKEQNSAFCWCFSVKVNIEDEAWATFKELVEEKKIEECSFVALRKWILMSYILIYSLPESLYQIIILYEGVCVCVCAFSGV